MCGICGIASARGPVDERRLRELARTLHHRGPDSEGIHLSANVGIAARRLAIIDLAAGDQPIANEDGSVVVVQNGEIYNYRELMHELERAGHVFRTRCDTEVLVHGYEQWGAALWERLRGMFAVAVWDARYRRLVLARDRFGIKPLAYRHAGDEAELVEECRARLRDSVRAHLVADVPVGVLLSGGVDSGALAALAAEESPERLRTFSIGFAESSFDELPGARAVARRYDTLHRELTLRPDAALLLPALAAAFDEPFADSSALPTYLVSRLAAEDVKVALSGEGSDELFGGYYTYVSDLLAERLGPLAAAARPLAERLPTSTRKASFDYRLKRFARAAHLPPLERHHGWKEIFSADARAELTGRRHGWDPVSLERERFAETGGYPLLARLQDVDFGGYLVDDLLVKTDRASMAWSLEARVPFLDTVVTNFAFSLPSGQKVRWFEKKRLLRKAVEPLLPPEVVHGPKRGFSIPAAAWLRGDLEAFARETLAPSTLRRQGVLHADAVVRVIDRHVSGREDLSRQLWGLLAFTLWYERHIEGVTRDVTLERVVA